MMIEFPYEMWMIYFMVWRTQDINKALFDIGLRAQNVKGVINFNQTLHISEMDWIIFLPLYVQWHLANPFSINLLSYIYVYFQVSQMNGCSFNYIGHSHKVQIIGVLIWARWKWPFMQVSMKKPELIEKCYSSFWKFIGDWLNQTVVICAAAIKGIRFYCITEI